jgi:hypothetical protein
MTLTIIHFLTIILGLALFEIITSIDNAVVNAHVLRTLPEKYRKIFLVWGILFAVFIVRGLLPFIIVKIANPSLNFVQAFTAAFSSNKEIIEYVEKSKPLLLLAGGVYLFLVFLGWLFLEEKNYAFLVEHFIHRQGFWFYAVSSIFLTIIIYFSLHKNPILALSASIGATAFFITDGFKKNAEAKEKELLDSRLSAWSKILYLEVLDASFSLDGVIGAFAFTIFVPLILIGNGVGAFVVNGAMYSIGMLGALMILESFGKEHPFWLAPLNTFILISLFLYLSYRELKYYEKHQ